MWGTKAKTSWSNKKLSLIEEIEVGITPEPKRNPLLYLAFGQDLTALLGLVRSSVIYRNVTILASVQRMEQKHNQNWREMIYREKKTQIFVEKPLFVFSLGCFQIGNCDMGEINKTTLTQHLNNLIRPQ